MASSSVRYFSKSTPKPKFAHSKSRETMSNKDRAELVSVLGKFDFGKSRESNDPQDLVPHLHRKLTRSRRFQNSVILDDGRIELISNSGYSGKHSAYALRDICHAI
jgi:hypothetical protein